MFNNLIGKNKELGRFLFCERYTLPPVKNAMYIAEGQDLKRGAVVDVNGVLVGTNSLMPYAVLEFDCDTRSGGKEASVFIKGEFNFDKLSFADGLSKDDMDNIVYNGSGIGIVIKPYAFDKEFSPQLAELAELFFLNTKNIEVPSKKAKVGYALYVDSDGNKHFICDKSIDAASIPDGWEFVGIVALREGDKATILYKTENTSVKWASMWLFKVNGLKLDGTDSFVLQQGPTSGSTPVEIGTFTASESATDLDTLVSELDTWLRANTTADGALADYNWHAEKHADKDGVDACFIVVDNINYQSRFTPIKSSTSGATAPLYMWDWCGFTTDYTTIKRKDGVNTYAVVWNKERFKAYNTNVNSPTDSLTSTGLFNEDGFNATTTVKAYYGTYDNYLDNMVPDEDSTTGAYTMFKGKGQEVFDALKDVSFPNLSGTATKVFAAEAWAASLGKLDGADFIVPSIDTAYEIFSAMKTDGSDPINAALVASGSSACSLSVARLVPARNSSSGAWLLHSIGSFYNNPFSNNLRACCVALLTL